MVEYLDGIATSGSAGTPIEFSMPSDYRRGSRIPAFTAFQLYLPTAVNFSYTVRHFDGQNWNELRSGTHVGKSGWNTARFSEPILGSVLEHDLKIEISGSVPNPVRYRILSAIGDSGVDIFNNSARNLIDYKSANNLLTADAFWMSKPNPSKFAVESLYFDNGSETTIDRLVIDPLTPGLTMSVYHSNDTEAEWDKKLWKRVPQTYHLMFKRDIAFPQPVSARFIKLEFSSLQARPYHPGFFENKISYNKHPKWVLDYFLMDIEQKRLDDSIPLQVNVIQDAYSLAYSYYLDDYQTALPKELGKVKNFSEFLQRSDLIDLIEPQMFARIKVAMRPYMTGTSMSRNLLGNALQASYKVRLDQDLDIAPQTKTIMEEFDLASNAIMTDVSTLNRETLMNELKCPPMFFFVECRHTYRVVEATFKEHRAYFAGIRDVRLVRDQYASNKNFRTYNETFGDSVNIEINDFA